MSEAPTLPAQTPGVFIGGGGSGTSLSGECAAVVADCGLSSVDFAPFEQLIDVVRAAQDRCRAYDEARWLTERERSFAVADVKPQREDSNERPLRRPTSRERYLSQSVAAPLLHTCFLQAHPGHAETNHGGALGYDGRFAPAAPQSRGLTLRVAVHAAFSTLVPGLMEMDRTTGLPRRRRDGSALPPDDLRALRDARIGAVLRAARDEDEPRLRSTDLMSSRRPRHAESERRALEQVLPEPPQVASATTAEASGSPRHGPSTDADPSGTSVARRAEGCVAGVVDSQEAAMREIVRSEYGSEYTRAQREAHARERETGSERTRCETDLRAAQRALRSAVTAGDPHDVGTAMLEARRLAVTFARAASDDRRAAAIVSALPSARLQMMRVAANAADRETSGAMPIVRRGAIHPSGQVLVPAAR